MLRSGECDAWAEVEKTHAVAGLGFQVPVLGNLVEVLESLLLGAYFIGARDTMLRSSVVSDCPQAKTGNVDARWPC